MKLKTLFTQLTQAENENNQRIQEIKAKIQESLSAQYADWKELQTALENIENYKDIEYMADFDGISAWVRFRGLSDVPEQEREYLENYVSTVSCARVDWENDALLSYLGDEELIINVDGRKHDRGVYQSGRQIIAENEYMDDNGEVDKVKRNELIEMHMEKTGFFPGVFTIDQHGNVFPVNTQAEKAK